MRGLLIICNTPFAAMASSVLHRPVESAAVQRPSSLNASGLIVDGRSSTLSRRPKLLRTGRRNRWEQPFNGTTYRSVPESCTKPRTYRCDRSLDHRVRLFDVIDRHILIDRIGFLRDILGGRPAIPMGYARG